MTLSHPYEPGRKLTEYGAWRIDKTLQTNKCCLVYVGTGGGKTFMSINAVGKIMPNAHLIVLTTAKQVNAHHWEDSIDSYNEVMRTNMSYFVTNYDKTHSENHSQDILNDLKKYPAMSSVIILDEAHKIKNPTSETSKMVIKVSKTPQVLRTIFLTATPISNSLLDSMTYLIIAGYYKNKTAFIRRHVKELDQHYQPIVKNRAGEIDNNLLNDPEIIINRIAKMTVEINTQKLLPEVKRSNIHLNSANPFKSNIEKFTNYIKTANTTRFKPCYPINVNLLLKTPNNDLHS